jgi:hypothetical protein
MTMIISVIILDSMLLTRMKREWISKSYPLMHIKVEELGERMIVGTGEI